MLSTVRGRYARRPVRGRPTALLRTGCRPPGKRRRGQKTSRHPPRDSTAVEGRNPCWEPVIQVSCWTRGRYIIIRYFRYWANATGWHQMASCSYDFLPLNVDSSFQAGIFHPDATHRARTPNGNGEDHLPSRLAPEPPVTFESPLGSSSLSRSSIILRSGSSSTRRLCCGRVLVSSNESTSMISTESLRRRWGTTADGIGSEKADKGRSTMVAIVSGKDE